MVLVEVWLGDIAPSGMALIARSTTKKASFDPSRSTVGAVRQMTLHARRFLHLPNRWTVPFWCAIVYASGGHNESQHA
jgi:hypothetical protein